MSDENKILQDFFPEIKKSQDSENSFPVLLEEDDADKKLRGFLSSPFITASLPLKDINKNIFKRKYNNISLSITSSAEKVPFGKYGRLLLTILTTHAVVSKNVESDGSVIVSYDSIRQLLKEMQLAPGRSNDIKEQLEYFSKSTFTFEERKSSVVQKSLFKDLLDLDDDIKADKVTATMVSTGIIPFMEAMQYLELGEEGKESKQYCINIKLSQAFVKFSKKHSVPINYTVYKNITSAVGKDIYAWLTYRNNSIKKGESIFIPSNALVEQFMPVKEGSHENQERTNYNYILNQIRDIKEKYYPDLNVSINQDGDGITLRKSNPQILPEDSRYVLVTATV
ncbi:MAG: plasmid encoded RepA protein [Treponema sp.]|nr:plasmid encoded RepA protein [Treponema sp.]